MFLEISSIRIEFSERLFKIGFSVTLQTHTDIVPLVFLWHRLCSTDHKIFSFFYFSLSSNDFPIACFLYFLFEEQKSLWETRKTEDSNTVRTSNCLVFSFGIFEKSENFCGSDRWWASCHHPQKWSCRTLWTRDLCLHLIWSGSQTSRCMYGVTYVLRFWDR